MFRLIEYLKKKNKRSHCIDEVDLFDRSFYQAQFTQYENFLEKEDILFFPKSNCYGAFKYEIVKTLLKDDKNFSSSYFNSEDSILLGSDGKKHTDAKRVVFSNLTFLKSESTVESVDLVSYLTNILIEKASHFHDGSFNMIDCIINPLVYTLMMKKIGAFESHPSFNLFIDDTVYQRKIQNIKRLYEIGQEVNEISINSFKKREFSRQMNDILDDFAQSKQYSEDELVRFIKTFISAGIVTTSSLLGSCVYFLDSCLQENMNKESDILNFIDEVLRIHSPSQFTFRKVTQDTIVSKIKIPKDSIIALSIGSANRDRHIFEAPEKFIPNRNIKNIAFGVGNHKCIGEKIAVDISKDFIQVILENYKQGIYYFDHRIETNNSIFFYKISHLNMTVKK